MIKRLLGQPADDAGKETPLPSGRLITTLEVAADRAVPTELSEAEVERIAARVADRLLQGSPADPVTRIVSDVAERLVREEIARMRAAAQAKTTASRPTSLRCDQPQ